MSLSSICLYDFKKVLALVSTFFIVCPLAFATNVINTIGYVEAPTAFSNGDVAMGHLTFKGGVTVPAGGSIVVDTTGILDGTIELNSTGALTLASDLHLGSTASMPNGGYIDGNGHAMFLAGKFTVPSDKRIKIIGDLALDGKGNEVILPNSSRFQLSDNVTLTLRNMNLHCSANSWPFEAFGDAARLVLQNVIVCYDRNFSFSQGNLFIHDDVVLTGTSRFAYASTGVMYIQPSATLMFDVGTTFSFSPGLTRPHTLAERGNIWMADAMSRLFLNGCTLALPDSGLQLKRGTVIFDNNVTINNLDSTGAGNTDVTKSFELGDGTADNDVTTHVLTGARVEVNGYLFDNTAL